MKNDYNHLKLFFLVGEVQQFRKEINAALASYAEALNLFQQVGDKLGEANVQSSKGWLELDSGNSKEGLDLLEQAMGAV